MEVITPPSRRTGAPRSRPAHACRNTGNTAPTAFLRRAWQCARRWGHVPERAAGHRGLGPPATRAGAAPGPFPVAAGGRWLSPPSSARV